MGSDLYSGAVLASHALTILGPRVNHLPKVLRAIEAAGDAVICVAAEESLPVRELRGLAMFIRQADGWLEDLVQLASEVLRRSDACARMRLAEQALAASQRHAILGRYILEMRHTLNNCLTSVLGNAELLLLEPGRLAADTREQIETMHTMALRLHEIFQRFSSLESEMQFAERKSQSETERPSQVVAAS
jgi:signal transduction histidine kinase